MFGLRFKIYGLIALAVIAALFGLYSYGKRTGRRAAELQQQQKAMKVIHDAQDVSKRVRALDDDAVGRELRERWSRD